MRVPSPSLPVTFFAWIALLLVSGPAFAAVARVTDVRLWAGPEGTRLVLEVTAPVEYDVFRSSRPRP
jgi:hypothetical protein